MLKIYRCSATYDWTANGNHFYRGGAIGTILTSTDYIFGNHPTYQTYLKTPLYTGLYVKNDDATASPNARTYNNIKLYVSGGSNCLYTIGEAASNTQTILNPADTTSVLSAVTFNTSVDLSVSLTQGAYKLFWIRRVPKATTFSSLTNTEGDVLVSMTATYTLS